MLVDTDAVRDIRYIQRAKFVPCCPADLVQRVDIAAMGVLSAPVLGEVGSWPEADGFRTNIGVNIFDEM